MRLNVPLIALKSTWGKRSIGFISAKAGHRQTYRGLWEWLYMVGLVELQTWRQLVMEIGPWGNTNPWSNFNSQKLQYNSRNTACSNLLVKKNRTHQSSFLNMRVNAWSFFFIIVLSYCYCYYYEYVLVTDIIQCVYIVMLLKCLGANIVMIMSIIL